MIGIFGGSGLYSLLDDPVTREVDTPYGAPSSGLHFGELAGREVVFLPRHGPNHEIPAHMVNYRANIWALGESGVTRIISPCAVGSLRREIEPGDVVVCDQLIDRTSGRVQTFHDGPKTVHLPWAQPFCQVLRPLAAKSVRTAGLSVHENGTIVVIQGPRFSTKAESKWYAAAGGDVVNMTQYPESYLARELGICFVNLSLVTDYDSGVSDESVSMDEIFAFFTSKLDALRVAISTLVAAIPDATPDCCATG